MYNSTIKKEGNPMIMNSEVMIANVDTDCQCNDYNEETDEYEPMEYCEGTCYEFQKEDVFHLLGEWYALNEIEEDDVILIKGRRMTWQNLEGSAKTNTLELDGILAINGDFRIEWKLDVPTKTLTATRWSHDEPMGAYFDFDFVKMLPCNVCGDPINAEIHAEELGMCLDCSNAYFTHEDEEEVEL
jgi:hypothetical protein